MKQKLSISIAAAAVILFLVYTLVIIPKPTPLRFSGAMKALQLWTAQRAYPNENFDDRLFHAAFESEMQKRGTRLSKRQSSEPWRQIGPHNIGGRTISVAVNPLNPKTIYAGSASGGLWRSFTEGKGALAWEYMPTGFPVLSVGAIAIAPQDSNLMFIGTGEVYGYRTSIGGVAVRTTRGSYGIGILKTTDGGATWAKSLDWQYNEMTGIQAMKIHPQHIRYIWAATSEGVYRSNDTGRTWDLVNPILMGTDIVLHPSDTNIIIAAHGNLNSAGGGIYRSTDAGSTWSKMTAGLPASFGGKILLALYPPNPNIVYASIGAGASSGSWLCKTTDGGDTWNVVTTTDYAVYQGWFAHFVGVDPTDSSKVVCGGVDLWKSTDGGTTLIRKSDWAAWYFGETIPGEPEGPPYYSHADHHAIAYHPTDPSIIYFGNDGGVFCSTDSGETFEGRNGGYQTTQFYNGFSSSWTDSMLAIGGMQDNATAIYEGTVAWRRVIGGDGCMTAMSPTSNDTMYGSSQNLNLLRSTNKGFNWSGIGVPSGGSTSFVGPFALAPSSPKIMYAGREKIFRSTTGGGGWIAMNNNVVLDPGNPILNVTVAPSNADVVYVTTAPVSSRGKIFRTTNGGTDWTNITGLLPDRYMIDVAVHPSDENIAYVTLSGFGTSHLYKTSNGGTAWSNIGSQLPDVPTSAVVIDPELPNIVYVGNDLGVYVTSNDGTQWSSFSEGLYDATLIMDLSISRANRAIRAVTHGNGVFERSLINTPTVVAENRPAIPDGFGLQQNYPNPFNPMTVIGYRLPVQSHVVITLHDAAGREVRSLVNDAKDAGFHSVTFDATAFASGTYFYRMTAGNYSETKKMTVVK
jgi:photosystem II stability/assembly factor-like uncharacterized protein